MRKLEEQLYVSSVTIETRGKNGSFVAVEDLTISDFPVRIKERSEPVVIDSVSENGQYSYRAPSSGARKCLSSRDFLSNKEEVATEIQELKTWVLEWFSKDVKALQEFSSKDSLAKFAEIKMLRALSDSLINFAQKSSDELVTIDSTLCPELNTLRNEGNVKTNKKTTSRLSLG